MRRVMAGLGRLGERCGTIAAWLYAYGGLKGCHIGQGGTHGAQPLAQGRIHALVLQMQDYPLDLRFIIDQALASTVWHAATQPVRINETG